MSKLRDNSKRAKRAITFLYIMIGMSVLSAAIVYWEYDMVSKNGDILNDAYIDESQMQELIIYGAGLVLGALILLVFAVLTYVFYIQWFRRAYYNMHQIVPKHQLKFGEGMAAGAWFIPFFNLVGPYQIMKDMYTHAQRLLGDKGIKKPNPKAMTIVGVWWAFWVISSIAEGIGGRSDAEQPFDLFQLLVFISLIGSALRIVAAVFAVRVIKNYHEMELLLPQLAEGVDTTTQSLSNDDILDSGM